MRIHIYICTPTLVFMYMCTYIYTRTITYVYINIRTYTQIYVDTYTDVGAYIASCVCYCFLSICTCIPIVFTFAFMSSAYKICLARGSRKCGHVPDTLPQALGAKPLYVGALDQQSNKHSTSQQEVMNRPFVSKLLESPGSNLMAPKGPRPRKGRVPSQGPLRTIRVCPGLIRTLPALSPDSAGPKYGPSIWALYKA